ncbi:hypothetical protein TELCIR_04247 [Teladorsagia circumcincta]|uniref:Uncharacterized protein n=1 Tax=Teladorsagia circumcincta TaxID=45464 RepID=A0A2G9UU49_TELCI|nr:hypothetical protein TELCIR_04247 [Teladorsagia circumcincta]
MVVVASDDVMLSSSFVEHAALGFAFAVLSLFVLAFAIIAVVLVTITNNCWWNCDSEGDPLMEDYNSLFPADDEDCETGNLEPIDTVIGTTPKNADIV